MDDPDLLGIGNIVIVIAMALIGYAFNNVRNTQKESEATQKERTDKLEENSRRDDDIIKTLIKDSEERSSKEMDRRIQNTEGLHNKIERENSRIQDKIEELNKVVYDNKCKCDIK